MRKKILLVEDEPMLRENVTELLEINGFDVMPTDSGDKAIEALAEFNPALILCDIKMPHYDGYWVLNESRKKTPAGKVPFVFISAKVDRSDVRTGMDLGADDYLTKPFTSEELLSAINARLERAAHQEIIREKHPAEASQGSEADFRLLTPTEKRILSQIAQNATSEEIARRHFISLKTVENHRSNITNKLGIKGHLSLLRYCLNNQRLILSQNW